MSRGRWAERVIAQGMSRRDMLKAMGAVSLAAAGAAGCISPAVTPSPIASPTIAPTATATPTAAPLSADLFVAVDPDPVRLVDKALDAYGGLGDVVKKGDKVFIKANYSFKQPDGYTKPIACSCASKSLGTSASGRSASRPAYVSMFRSRRSAAGTLPRFCRICRAFRITRPAPRSCTETSRSDR